MLTYNIDLDVTPGAIPTIVHVKQYQTDALIKFNLYTRNGALTIGSSPTCTVRGTKTDGNGYSENATYTAATTTVSVQLTEQMTVVAGRQPYELTVTDSTGKMVTATFYLDVQRAALDRDTISNSKIREILDVTDKADEIFAAAEAIEDYTYPAQEITGYLLKQKSENLMGLANPSSANVRRITLQNNRIVQTVTANNPTGSTYYSFLISGTVRYVGGAEESVLNNLTASDFTDFNFDTSRNLILDLSMVYSSKNNQTSKTGYVIIATRNSTTGEITKYNLGEYNYSSNIGTAKDFSVQMFYRLPELAVNKNIAIIYVSRYPNMEQEVTISLRQTVPYANFGSLSFTSVASQKYESGDLLEMNGMVYGVKDDLNTGDAITPGQNVERTNMSSELKYLTGRSVNDLTRHFLGKKAINLMDLAPEASPGNKRDIRLEQNTVYFKPASNASTHSGGTHYGFVISGTPKFITTHSIIDYESTYLDGLTEDDFVPIYQSSTAYDLCVTIDIDVELAENIDLNSKNVRMCSVGIATYNSNPKTTDLDDDELSETYITKYYTDMTLLRTQRFSKTIEVNLSERLPKIISNGNLAVFFISPSPNIKGRVSVSFSFKSIKLTSGLGSYWGPEIDESVHAINSNIIDSGRESSTICFITDCHWKDNKKKSPALVKQIIDRCNIDYFVNGGDMIKAFNTAGKYAAMDELNECLSAFREADIRLPMITIYGNHDRNRDGNEAKKDPDPSVVAANVLSVDEHLLLTQERSTYSFYGIKAIDNTAISGVVDHNDVIYWDNDVYRFAGIYWHGYQDNTQRPVSWTTELFNTDKPVIIFNHGIWFHVRADMTNDTIHEQWLLDVLEPYKNQIRCIIQGHSHLEGYRKAWNQVPVLIHDCDAFRGAKSVANTITEQSFSVITVNADEIKVVKVGRGSDYTITNSTAPWLYIYSTGEFRECQ